MMNRNILNPMMWTTGSGPTPPTPVDAGIYWSSSLGLISLSEDGENWITIADKNLGASQVYNDGDNLSEANCGKYYQWGNNYGFPYGLTTMSTTQVDASNYGPYYYSDTFITEHSWDLSNNYNLWGATTGTNKAMQGPCLNGYHIPNKDENVALVNILTALGIDTSNGICMKTYLKMPFVGYRYGSSAGVSNQGTGASYWSSTAYSTGIAYYLYFNSGGLNPQMVNSRSHGFSIRPFKNTSVSPTSSWVTLFDGGSGKGIFWGAAEGLISISSDGENRITIADKNLGATVVYTNGDELSEANCGKYFQRGNNYGFPRSGEVTTSSTQVDATNYGPYYYSDTFIKSQDWSSVRNDNLRGGVVDTTRSKQGPCDSLYHVPSNTERQSLLGIMSSLGLNIGQGSNVKTFLKAPYTGYYSYGTSGNPQHYGQDGIFWSSTSAGDKTAYSMYFTTSTIHPHSNDSRGIGCPIRPFKNEPVAPDSTWTKLF